MQCQALGDEKGKIHNLQTSFFHDPRESQQSSTNCSVAETEHPWGQISI